MSPLERDVDVTLDVLYVTNDIPYRAVHHENLTYVRALPKKRNNVLGG